MVSFSKQNAELVLLGLPQRCHGFGLASKCPAIAEATKAKLRTQHAALDPFALKKSIEVKLRKFFTALGNLNREAMKP
jgi:hypothetical protein